MALVKSSLLILTLAGGLIPLHAQSGATPESDTYAFRMSVDEVVLTFHAADAGGHPITDLRLDELHLLDNGALPAKILSFDSEPDLPIRAALLLDTSSSMHAALPRAKSIAEQFARRLLRLSTDQALVTEFGFTSNLAQPFTSDPETLSRTIQNIHEGKMNPLGGTSVYDTVFRTCYYPFAKTGPTPSGNVLLLFSDGQDNASHTSLEEAAATCQHTNTAIYSFDIAPGNDSLGAETLRDLASQTGGRVFHVPATDPDAAIITALAAIEADTRSQYRLVYRPARLRHDGSFHKIHLQLPARATQLAVRSGYYSPVH